MPHSVLIVEDNPDIVVGLQDLLAHDGYEVRVVGTCAHAIAQARTSRFKAILLDLTLPDGDGLNVLGMVREHDPSLPVIILTADTSTEKTIGTLTCGAFAYLTKPYNREELRQVLRRAIGTHELAAKVTEVECLLRESEERFRSIVESAQDAIIVADDRGLILSWNRSAAVMFGHTDQATIGQPLTALMPARYREAHKKGLARMKCRGTGTLLGSAVELHGLRKDGTEFPIELSLSSWQSSGRTFHSGIIRDISERKLAETALRRSEERLECVITGSNDGYWDGIPLPGSHWSSPDTSVWWSPRVREMLGYSQEEFPDVLESWSSRLHPDDVNRVYTALTAHIEQREPYDIEYRLRTKREGYRWFRARGRASWDIEGRLTRMAGSLQSIMDRSREAEADRTGGRALKHDSALWDWDLATGQLVWSPQLGQLCSAIDTSHPLTLSDWLACVHPDDRAQFAASLQRIGDRAGDDIVLSHRLVRQSAGSRRLVWSGHIIRDHAGRPVHILGTVEIRDEERAPGT